MQNILKGKAFVYGKNVDTDQIYPAPLLTITDADKVAQHAMQGIDPDFVTECATGDFVVATTNFGCGSSREHAAVCLKGAGVAAILAESFGRIFYRNAINLGVLALVCKGLAAKTERGDRLTLDLARSLVTNERTGQAFAIEPLSDTVRQIVEAGGIKPLMRQRFATRD